MFLFAENSLAKNSPCSPHRLFYHP